MPDPAKKNNIDPNCEPLHAALRKSYPKLACAPALIERFTLVNFPLSDPIFVGS